MSVAELKQAMLGKLADAPKTNEDDTNKGINNVYGPPAGRKPGTLDAKWGDTPKEAPDGYPDNYSTAVKREARDDRAGVIERSFDSPKTTAPAEQSLMAQYLEHAAEGQPHSPILQRGHTSKVVTAAADTETLTETVMRVVGRR